MVVDDDEDDGDYVLVEIEKSDEADDDVEYIFC